VLIACLLTLGVRSLLSRLFAEDPWGYSDRSRNAVHGKGKGFLDGSETGVIFSNGCEHVKPSDI
jgi:hypothetical protein